MSHQFSSWLFAAAAASLISSAAGAQTLAVDTADATALGQPLSITQRYVPVKGPRAPLALLVEDSVTVASNADTVEAPQQPAIVEEVGDRPAIAALAPGRLAITVSTQRVSNDAAVFQRGQTPPSRR